MEHFRLWSPSIQTFNFPSTIVTISQSSLKKGTPDIKPIEIVNIHPTKPLKTTFRIYKFQVIFPITLHRRLDFRLGTPGIQTFNFITTIVAILQFYLENVAREIKPDEIVTIHLTKPLKITLRISKFQLIFPTYTLDRHVHFHLKTPGTPTSRWHL